MCRMVWLGPRFADGCAGGCTERATLRVYGLGNFELVGWRADLAEMVTPVLKYDGFKGGSMLGGDPGDDVDFSVLDRDRPVDGPMPREDEVD